MLRALAASRTAVQALRCAVPSLRPAHGAPVVVRWFSATAAADSASSPAAAGGAASATEVAASGKRPHVGVAVTVLRPIPPKVDPAAAATEAATDASTKPNPLARLTARSSSQFEVLLVRRSKAPMAGFWGLPGGSLELGESMGHCAQREAREETGLHVTTNQHPESFFTTQYVLPMNGPRAGQDGHYVLVHMLADYPLSRAAGAGGEQQAVAGDDAAEVRWFPASQLRSMLTLQKRDQAKQREERRAKASAANVDADKADEAQEAADDVSATAAAEDSPVDSASSEHPRLIPAVVRVVDAAVALRREQLREKEQKMFPRRTSANRKRAEKGNKKEEGDKEGSSSAPQQKRPSEQRKPKQRQERVEDPLTRKPPASRLA